MDLETAKKLLNSKAVQAYIEGMEDDTKVALDSAKDNIGEMGDFPPKALSTYKKERDDLDDASGEFNGAFNAVTWGKAKDGKALIAAYKAWVIALTVLEEDNVLYGAYVEAGAAASTAIFIAVLIETVKAVQKACENIVKELEALDKLLKQAKREVTQAEIQRALNIAISVVSLLLPPMRLGRSIAVAAGTLTVQLILDAALGPGKPGAIGIANSAGGDVIGLPKLVSTPKAKFGGVASLIIGIKLDTDEVGDAKKIVEAIKDRIKSTQKTLEMLDPFLNIGADKLAKMQDGFNEALKEAKSKSNAYKSGEAKRLGLVRELQKMK